MERIVVEYYFDEGNELSDFNLEISQDFPLTAKIENNTLMLEANPDIGGELIINIEDEPFDEAAISFSDAQGTAHLKHGMIINSLSPENRSGPIEIMQCCGRDGSYAILSLAPGDKFQCTGFYIVEIEI